jgi:hypothetical protein
MLVGLVLWVVVVVVAVARLEWTFEKNSFFLFFFLLYFQVFSCLVNLWCLTWDKENVGSGEANFFSSIFSHAFLSPMHYAFFFSIVI